MRKRVQVKSRDKQAHGSFFAFRSLIAGRESTVVLMLCLVGALRVFVFSAAFPLFDNVDELQHFDLVLKYSHGSVPHKLPYFGSQASDLIALYCSPEYSNPSDFGLSRFPPPIWTFPREAVAKRLTSASHAQQREKNYEALEPPVYYVVAGFWWKIGRLLGLGGGPALYWIRFLNVVVYGLLVWLSYAFVRRFYGGLYLRIGVPFLLAFFPQDILFSINNDILSPLLFLASLYCLVDICLSDTRPYWFYALGGLLVAATMMTKLTNFAILPALGVTVLLKLRRLLIGGTRPVEVWKTVVLASCAAIPLLSWLTWNLVFVGDATASAEKLQALGWSVKPFGKMWPHPIFTAGGAYIFARGLIVGFWRGEFVWYGTTLASPSADTFYCVSSILLVTASIVGLFLHRRKAQTTDRFVRGMCLSVVGLSILPMVLISVVYDFGNCWHPSRQFPYMTSGRLIVGVLVPFLCLYLDGVRSALPGARMAFVRVAFVLVAAAVMMGSEVMLSLGVFGSRFNWFHMVHWPV